MEKQWASGSPTFADGDSVTVPAGATVVLDAPTPHLASFEVFGTVVVSNWTSCLEADAIIVRNGGAIRAGTDGYLLDGMTPNRVWLKGVTLAVEQGGAVSADGAGYAGTNGPCWTASVTRLAIDPGNGRNFSPFGGVYGGSDGFTRRYYREGAKYASAPQPYGSAEWPYDAGSGGGALVRAGGGAIVLDFSGAVTVNGAVSANASTAGYGGYPSWESNGNKAEGMWNYMNAPYGSGGGVLIVCASIAGSGSVTANSGILASGNRGGYGGGSGGRVAVHYDPAVQAASACSVRFEARGGMSSAYVRGEFPGDPGTLWFTDNQFLESYAATGWTFAGTWCSGVGQPASFETAGDLSLAGGQLAFAEPMALSVGGNLTIAGTLRYAEMSGLIFASNATIAVGGDVTVTDAKLSLLAGGAVDVTGDFMMSDSADKYKGALLYLTAAATNGTENAYGLSLDVGGRWSVGKNAIVVPECHRTDGAIPALACNDFVLDAGGMVLASQRGYEKGPGHETKNSNYLGSGHGGTAGGAYQGTVTYGDATQPLEPGSGDGSAGSSCLVRGGGVVYLIVRNEGRVNGSILADSEDHTLTDIGKVGYFSGASGGSVYLRVKHLYGDAAAVVRAGAVARSDAYNGNNLGGGGRVAIWTSLDDSPWKSAWTAATVAPAQYKAGSTPNHIPADGTLHWGALPSTQIAVDATPARYGTVTPPWGLSELADTGRDNVFDIVRKTFDDGLVAVEVEPGHRVFAARCEVFKDGESVRVSSDYPFAYATPAVYTTMSARWTFESEQWSVIADAQGAGAVQFADGGAGPTATNWCGAGTSVTLTATPDATHAFLCWTGDGITAYNGAQNPLTLTTGAAPMNLKANFISVDPSHAAADVECTDGEMPALGPGDRVTVPAGVTTVLSSATPRLGRLEVSGTLVVSNWATRVDADAIVVRSGGAVKAGTDGYVVGGVLPNRVWLKGATLAVEAGGRIDADGAGYAGTNGPCWTASVSRGVLTSTRNISPWGGCYGGRGGYYRYYGTWNTTWDQAHGAPPEPYGSAEWPLEAGSGGGAFVRSGGGAIYLEFSGDVTIDGRISADASAAMYAGFPAGESVVQYGGSWDYVNASYGSGGGIVIVCSSVTGAGTVSASSVLTDGNNRVGYGGGSGGRIAVHYDATAQQAAVCSVRFRARGGVSHAQSYRGAWYGDPGTLWFTDNRFLESYAASGWTFAGTWNSGAGAPTGFVQTGDLLVEDAQLRFPEPFALTVGGMLCVTGTVRFATANGLLFGAASTVNAGSVTVAGAKLAFEDGGSLSAAGDILLQDGSDAYHGALLSLQAGATNGLNGAYGLACTAGGELFVGKNAVVLPYCHLTCGAIPAFFCRDLHVDAAGIVDASSKGYLDKGPIVVTSARGSSYGGLGGGGNQGLPCYGSETEPLTPGCGDCYGIRGGGVVFLNVSHRATIDGQILADAKDTVMVPDGGGGWHSGAAGGSVYLRIQRLVGGDGALVRAMGGGPGGYNLGDTGKGGGGRIAIYTGRNESGWKDNPERVNAAAYQDGAAANYLPQDGTVYWGDLPMPGLLLIVR